MREKISEVSILGLSAYYHDSAAALIKGGKIIAAAQEERFSRKKHDPGFPEKALTYCLREADIKLENVDYVIFYDKPLLKFERLLETYLSYAPHGLRSFIAAMPVWLKEKLYLKTVLKKELAKTCNCSVKKLPTLLFNEHHKSHAASAFYPGPFEKAAVICLDGVGEWAATSVWSGDGHRLMPVWQIDFPHSLGLLYSAFTYYTGFKVNSGEYKLMGLAPYGEPKYVRLILEHLLDVKDDGTFRLNMEYFNYPVGFTMTGPKFAELFDAPVRSPESPLTQQVMDIARSIQVVTEEIVLKMARSVHRELGVDNLCLAGGVALNCVSNGRLLREGPFREIWIQPAAGDAGGALGAAFSVWHEYLEQERKVNRNDSMQGAYLGPSYPNEEVRESLKRLGACCRYVDDDRLFAELAERIASGEVIGWMQGRMEFGPRALGSRSIIGDPGNSEIQSKMNLKIKYRESFRPFAPSVLAERVSDYFEHTTPSPYMLMVATIKEELRIEMTPEQEELFGIEKLKIRRSRLPAITHVDYSARIQTVHEHTNPRYYHLLKEVEKKTGCPVLVNTSFNVRGEPIVNTPEDAYRCFMRTEMDCLVIENYIMVKDEQPGWKDDDTWQEEFELD